jgi:pimeloyl-ACP methyl ester carboxylesterase
MLAQPLIENAQGLGKCLGQSGSPRRVNTVNTHNMQRDDRAVDLRIFAALRVAAQLVVSLALLAWTPSFALAQPADAQYGAELEGFDYPYPVQHFAFTSQGEAMSMAYMDLAPTNPNGRTVVMFHGKNFCSASWDSLLDRLRDAGFRVIAVDQIGFCKSTKPEHYVFTFQQLAANTHALLASLGVSKVTIVAHSTGGMLGMRYALMYPDDVEQLAMISPIGLEDWKAKGAPWLSLDQWEARERKTNAASLRAYEQNTYYAGTWKPAYERWVQMYTGMFAGPGKDLVARNSAALYDMIYTQPVFYEFEQIKTPIVLIIGDKDTTAIGKDNAPPAVRETLGHYPELGNEATRRFPNAKLIEFPDLGHAGWLQDPERVGQALVMSLIGAKP